MLSVNCTWCVCVCVCVCVCADENMDVLYFLSMKTPPAGTPDNLIGLSKLYQDVLAIAPSAVNEESGEEQPSTAAAASSAPAAAAAGAGGPASRRGASSRGRGAAADAEARVKDGKESSQNRLITRATHFRYKLLQALQGNTMLPHLFQTLICLFALQARRVH